MIAVGLVGVVVLVLLNAFFVAVEFALVAVDRTQVELQAAEDRRAGVALAVLRRLNLHLSGAQFGITLCSLGLGVLAEPVVAPLLEPLLGGLAAGDRALAWSVVLALVLTTAVQMVVGELVPKSVAVARPLPSVLRLAGAIRVFTVVFGPIVRACNAVADRMVRAVGLEPTEELSATRSREELRQLVQSSQEHGALASDEAVLLRRTFRFEEKTVAEALTPRTAVRWLVEDATSGDLVDLAQRTGFSRFPVCRRSLDDVVGVVHAKHVLRLPAGERRSRPVAELVRPVAVVPESVRLPELFARMQEESGQFAVVVDEYGGTAGIITVEDLVEEVVGEIDDEYDPAAARARRDRSGGVVLPGQYRTDEVREACGFEVPEGEYETLAGFLMDRLGRVPAVGDAVEADGWRLTVSRMDRRRVDRVRLVRRSDAPVADGGTARP